MTEMTKDRRYFLVISVPIIYPFVVYRFVYESNNQSVPFQHWGSYSNTYGDQPNNFGGDQHCVLINGAYKTWTSNLGTWNDFECSGEFNYICEKKVQD